MGYLYVFEANDHVKLGRTNNPKVRTSQHSRELGIEIELDALWECSECVIVEDATKKKLRNAPQLTKERFLIDKTEVIAAVVESAKECDVGLTKFSSDQLPRSMTKKPNSQYVRYEFQLDREFSDKLQAWINTNMTGASKASIVRQAMELYMERRS